MIGRPDVGIFAPLVESLDRQTFRDFEVVVVDGLYGQRAPEVWEPLLDAAGSHQETSKGGTVSRVGNVRWTRFPDSPWYRAGYLAISAPKNHGIVHANGQLVVTIDDCCEFGPDWLAKFWEAHRRGYLATSALHYHRGGGFHFSAGRESVCRGRYGWPGGAFGYTSFRLADALRINGYDEGFDGSKCLEDGDFSSRMGMIGRRYRVARNHIVIEHEHGDVSPDAWPVPAPAPKLDRSIKCNGIHDRIVQARTGEDRIQANRRGYTDEEWSQYGPPCAYRDGATCSTSRLPCNWYKVAGEPDSGDWHGADTNWPNVREWVPVFDLADRWRARRRIEGRSEEIPT